MAKVIGGVQQGPIELDVVGGAGDAVIGHGNVVPLVGQYRVRAVGRDVGENSGLAGCDILKSEVRHKLNGGIARPSWGGSHLGNAELKDARARAPFDGHDLARSSTV